MQVLVVAWLIATTFFLICYASPCAKLPPKAQLQYFELGGDDQDIFAGVDDTDARGLKHFPRLWQATQSRSTALVLENTNEDVVVADDHGAQMPVSTCPYADSQLSLQLQHERTSTSTRLSAAGAPRTSSIPRRSCS